MYQTYLQSKFSINVMYAFEILTAFEDIKNPLIAEGKI
jgi:hypothetical protein